MLADSKQGDSLASRIGLRKYSDYTKLIRVTARVPALFQNDPNPSFRNAAKVLTLADITKAKRFWILEAQKPMKKDMKRRKYRRLCPKVRDDGVIVVGGRTKKWMEMSYNKSEVPLGFNTNMISRGCTRSTCISWGIMECQLRQTRSARDFG